MGLVPLQAYDCQLEYMRAVVKALDGGSNALLESPTGTGKTLCLLCAALGWRRHRQQAVTAARTSWEAQATAPKVAVPRIFYASRTHTQLRQVMSELKRTCYKPWSVVLGSRQHFCLHQSVSRHTGARQNAMCRKVVDEQKCPYHIGFRKCGSKVSTALKDIEEIVHSCKEANVCPYFKVREDAKEAELLLLPYDYLLGTQTREALQVPLKNSILIFDEGHNIERSCEEIASFELSQADIAGAISEIDDAFDLVERGEVDDEVLKDVPCETFLKHLNLFKKHLFGLEDSISAEKLEKDAAADRSIFKARGGHVLDLLLRQSERGFGTDKEDLKHIAHVIRSATDVLTRGQETANSGGLYLDKIQMLLSTAFKCDREELDNNYQLLITEEPKKGTKRKAVDFFTTDGSAAPDAPTPRTLYLWCFSCSVAMRDLQKQEVYSVIITSGTLSPLQSTADAFGVPFPVMLENTHVIDASKQLMAAVVGRGPQQGSLDATFSNRSELAYAKELGGTVKRLAANTPDGLLLAFSSYGMKESIFETWKRLGMLTEIACEKPIFEEPKGNNETKKVMQEYSAALARGGNGAILAAVCRGKLCEGIDFTDKQCRTVVMVGIPYPARNELRVMLKQDFLDAKGVRGDGQRWYHREAIRAVNQTIGRAIRHRTDYGAVLLCDSRYASGSRLSNQASGLSSWLRPQVAVMSLEEAVKACQRFFGYAPNLGDKKGAPVAENTPSLTTNGEDPPELDKKPLIKSQSARSVVRALLSGKAVECPSSVQPRQPPATPQGRLLPPTSRPRAPANQPATLTAFRRPGDDRIEEMQWQQDAAALLPRMDMDIVRKQLPIVRKESPEAVMGSSESMERALEAFKSIASCLLPVMCFDTAREEGIRERLVREFATLLPKPLRLTWRSTVEEVLQQQGSNRAIWR